VGRLCPLAGSSTVRVGGQSGRRPRGRGRDGIRSALQRRPRQAASGFRRRRAEQQGAACTAPSPSTVVGIHRRRPDSPDQREKPPGSRAAHRHPRTTAPASPMYAGTSPFGIARQEFFARSRDVSRRRGQLLEQALCSREIRVSGSRARDCNSARRYGVRGGAPRRKLPQWSIRRRYCCEKDDEATIADRDGFIVHLDDRSLVNESRNDLNR
jgi:hypothetical protein